MTVSSPDEPTTEELRVAQVRRELHERDSARGAFDEHDTAQHERRADKAEYLRRRLEERERAEREAAEREGRS